MTTMDGHRWRRIDELFQQALDRDARERSAFLRSEAGDDSELILEVSTLLSAHERTGPFLEEPAHGGASRLLELDTQSDIDDPLGARLGPWRITKALAAGGMGAVYLAVRDDDAYRKQVAIKLVRRGMLGSSGARREELVRRFHIERQALANLDHPSIARLIDGGTSDDGRPYLVMEYIEGLPIDAFCDERKLTTDQRLNLFCAVCEAVQHAHQNLVIHRDLKPGNILVTPDGHPKLLDFGLAKLLDSHRNALASQVTATGEFMGTFAYAAPEQLSEMPSGSALDTRSDVYSLGMILYRLLAGRHAYDTTGAMSDVLRRITTEPPVPPAQVNRALNGELDTIALKALAKEPARRYQSAGDLRADVERYLRGEPILAKADSGWYVLRKTMRRYRAPLAVAGGALILVTAFAVVATLQASRLADQRASLAQALRISNIERGRAMGFTGNIPLAEELIWPQYLAERDQPADKSDPDQLAHWALWELYQNVPCLRTMRVELPSIDAMACSTDGRWIALTARGQRPIVIDAVTGAVLHRLDVKAGHTGAISARPGTSEFAVAGFDGVISVWNAESGRMLRQFTPQAPVHSLAYSPTGDRLMAAAMNRALVLDSDQLELMLAIDVPETIVTGLAMDTNDSLLAIGGADGRVWMCDASTGERGYALFDDGRRCSSLAFSPDNRFLAADTNGTMVALIDVASRTVVAHLEGATGWIRDLEFQPLSTDRYVLAGAGFDKRVHVWEFSVDASSGSSVSWKRVRDYGGHTAPLFALHFSSDGTTLLSAGGDACIRVWETAGAGGLTRWPEAGTIFDVQFMPDGRTIVNAKGDQDFAICVRDVDSGAMVRRFAGHRAAVSSIAISPDGRTLASAGYDGTIRTWPMSEPNAAPGWMRQTGAATVNSVTWSPDGSRIAAAVDRGAIQIFDASNGTPVESVSVSSDRIPSLRYSPDGRFLAAAVMPQNSVVLIDCHTGQKRELAGHHQPIRIVRFSPDGRLLASAGDDLMVRLWSMSDDTFGQCVAELEGHQQDIFALAFSPDGSKLASAGRSGGIKLWSVLTGRCLVTLPGHRDMVFNINFSPDGHRLVSGGRDGAIGVWDLHYFEQHIEGNLDHQRDRTSRAPN